MQQTWVFVGPIAHPKELSFGLWRHGAQGSRNQAGGGESVWAPGYECDEDLNGTEASGLN